MLRKFAISAAVVVLSAGAGAFVASSPAQADSAVGCRYPRVCFYLTDGDWDDKVPSASYQDVTSTWQTLGRGGRGAFIMHNTRNDDVAYVHFTNGRTACASPNGGVNLRAFGTADKVRISSSATC
jgi:hypothetical protein